MPFVKFEIPSPPAIDVKLSGNGFSITTAALETHGLGSAEYVNLYWDSDLHIIGIAPSSKEDKSAFKITQRGRGTTTKFVTATKFFDAFGIPAEDASAASGLKNIDGIAAFDINLPSATASKPYTGKRRGRKPKATSSEN